MISAFATLAALAVNGAQMETKFRDMFSEKHNSGLTNAGDASAPFHKLYNGVVTAGQSGYAVVFTIAITFAVLACSVVVIKIFAAGNGKAVTEEKDKLQRNLLYVFFLTILGTLVAVIYNTFLW